MKPKAWRRNGPADKISKAVEKEDSKKAARDAFESSLHDRAYWLSKTIAERFEAVEAMRQSVYGYDPATARLERVLTIVSLQDLKLLNTIKKPPANAGGCAHPI